PHTPHVSFHPNTNTHSVPPFFSVCLCVFLSPSLSLYLSLPLPLSLSLSLSLSHSLSSYYSLCLPLTASLSLSLLYLSLPLALNFYLFLISSAFNFMPKQNWISHPTSKPPHSTSSQLFTSVYQCIHSCATQRTHWTCCVL